MGGKSTISNSEQRLGNLRVQTSMYGLAVRLMWGQPRVTGNLLWFGNFEAVAVTTTEETGGKGGGSVRQVNTTFNYYAAAMMALGRGPIAGIASAWKDKQRYVGGSVPGRLDALTQDIVIPPAGGSVTLTIPPGAALTFVASVSIPEAPAYADWNVA